MPAGKATYDGLLRQLADCKRKIENLRAAARGYEMLGDDDLANAIFDDVRRLGKRLVQLNSRIGYLERDDNGDRILGE